MTLHAAKGLEFDWVIIPGLARGARAEQRELLLWDEYLSPGSEGRGFLFAVGGNRKRDEPGLYDYLHELRRRQRSRELTRLLYVGATRAARRLFLSASLPRDSDSGEWKRPPESVLLSRLWPDIASLAQKQEQDWKAIGRTHPSAPPDGASSHFLHRLQGLAPLTPEFFEEPSASEEPSAGEEPSACEEPSALLPDPTARHIGTLIHETLQRLSTLDAKALQGFKPASWRSWWQLRLRAMSMYGPSLQRAAKTVEESVARVLADPVGRGLLDCERQEARSEFALSTLDEWGEVREHIIDRTYVEQGELWIVDYKSALPAPGESVQDFLERQRERYRSQLEQYRAAMQSIENRPVKTALYFTGLPQWLEVE